MTERLYYQNPDVLEFQAVVIGAEQFESRYRICLDRSAFYPTSGGQLFDTGQLGDQSVIDVIEIDGDIWHVIENAPAYKIGDMITGKVDAVRRRDNMQKHTGQHILSQAFITVAGAATVSSRLGEDDCTVDLDREQITEEDIIRAETLANEVIFENRPVSISFVPFEKLQSLPLRKIPDRQEGEFRIITIEGFDCSACGGTHCRATGAVGIIKITGREKVRGTARLHFLTGLMALDDYRWRHRQIEEISNLFTRHGRESAEGVRNLLNENAQMRKKIGGLKRELLPLRMDKWRSDATEINGLKIIALDFSGEDVADAKDAVLAIIRQYPAIALIGVDDKLVIGVGTGISKSAKDILTAVMARLGGRGGGSAQLAQGGGFQPDGVKVLLADPSSILDI
jgi:alanyl-tRNA synthetase